MRVQLLATQPGMALYQVTGSNTAVVVDTRDMSTFDPVPVPTALSQRGWKALDDGFEAPKAWNDIADAAVDDFAVIPDASKPAKKTAKRSYRAPTKVVQDMSRGLKAYSVHQTALGVTPELLSLANRLVTGASLSVDELDPLRSAYSAGVGVPPNGSTSLSGSNIAYLVTGGDSGREWIDKIASRTAELAATPASKPAPAPKSAPTATPAAPANPASPQTPTTDDFGKQTTDPTDPAGWVDVTKPHQFLADSDDPATCGVCGNSHDDKIHDPTAVAAFQKQLDDAAGSPTPPAAPSPQASTPATAPVTSSGFSYDPGCTYFGKMAGEDLLDGMDMPDDGMDNPDESPPGGDEAAAGDDDDSTAIGVTGMLMKDPNGQWFEYDNGTWSPTQEPDPDADDIVQLDEETANSLADAIDSGGDDSGDDSGDGSMPSPVKKTSDGTYALRITEKQLFKNAEPYLNLSLYDNLFASVPYVDPAVRSKNATNQPRQGGGKFGSAGGSSVASGDSGGGQDPSDGSDPSSADTTESVSGVQVARLTQDHEVVTDTAARIQEYVDSNKPDTSPSATPDDTGNVDADTVVAAGADPALAPPTIDAPTTDTPDTADTGSEDSDSGPDDSDVAPLFLALVDPDDTQAVLKLLAIIPADPDAGTDVECYERQGTQWVQDPDDLTQLQGVAPPPAVEITDQGELQDVENQIASSTASPKAVAAAGILAAYYPDGQIAFASITEHTSDETGALTASQRSGAILLPSYRGEDTWPTDIRLRIAEFVAGVEASPKDVQNTDRLRQYWEHGAGAAKIRWGEPNDFYRCRDHLTKYLGTKERASGYCALRHRAVLGVWPGQEDGGRHKNTGIE